MSNNRWPKWDMTLKGVFFRLPPLCGGAKSQTGWKVGGVGGQLYINPERLSQSFNQENNTGITRSSMALLIQLFICAAVISFTEGFDHEDMKQAMLQKLGLTELPRIQKRDLENLVIPAHIKNKYLSMLKLHNKRKKRSVPSLAGILRGIHGNAGGLQLKNGNYFLKMLY